MSVLERIPALYYQTLAVDIRDTLRGNDGEVTDNHLSFFQPKAGINWASLRKPVVNSKIGVLTNEEMATSGAEIDSISGTYTTKRYGLNIAGRNSGITLQDLYVTVQKLGNGVVYYLPTGGEAEPYRLSDFNGYYPDAPQPLFGALQGEVVLNSATEVSLDYFEATGSKEGALTFNDLYESTDENGNKIEWRKGLVLLDTENLRYRFVLDKITASFIQNNQEKTFNAVQFLTSLPYTTLIDTNSVVNQEWKNHRIYAIPDGMFTLTINKIPESGGGGGNTGTTSAFRLSVGSEYPKFNGVGSGTTDIYKTVLIRFTLSFNSGVGNIDSLSVRLYTDKNHTNEIDSEQLGSFTDFFGSKDFNVTLDNKNLTTNAWVGIWLDGNLQFFKQVAMPRQERPTAI